MQVVGWDILWRMMMHVGLKATPRKFYQVCKPDVQRRANRSVNSESPVRAAHTLQMQKTITIKGHWSWLELQPSMCACPCPRRVQRPVDSPSHMEFVWNLCKNLCTWICIYSLQRSCIMQTLPTFHMDIEDGTPCKIIPMKPIRIDSKPTMRIDCKPTTMFTHCHVLMHAQNSIITYLRQLRCAMLTIASTQMPNQLSEKTAVTPIQSSSH